MATDRYRYFRIEGREILEQLQTALLELERGAAPAEVVPRLLRLAHTLKGAARVVKQSQIADQSHALEELLLPSRDAGATLSAETIERALAQVDAMRTRLLQISPVVDESSGKTDAGGQEQAFSADKSQLRELDALLGGIAELSRELGVVARSSNALERTRDLAELVADELSPRRVLGAGENGRTKVRSLAEELETSLATVERELRTALEQVARELDEVREAAQRLRLVPAELMWSSLERTARDAAVSLGKRVRLVTCGGDIRLDAGLLGLAQHALTQAVRNAVAHGIETPAERALLAKPAESELTVEVLRHDGQIVFSCRDDGRGLDLDAVRRSAERRGLPASVVSKLNAEGLFQLLLRGGISTSSTVSGLSGRGIGLDLVREIADKLAGTIAFQSAEGHGTTLAITVPVSQSGLLALLVEAAGQVVAIPLSAVRGTSRQLPNEINHSADGDTVVALGKLVPYVVLARVLGQSEAEDHGRRVRSAVLVEAAGASLIIGVDRLLGTEHIVARTLPELVALGKVISGATLDREGNPRLVLSPEGLLESARLRGRAPSSPTLRRAPILIIDDSLTTRMLEQSILESAGYEVELACSAEEGLDKARARKFALFLVDVEMPGMDGYAFIETTRRDLALRDVPAILVTSRASAEDVQRGLAVGARAHIAKGEFDQGGLLDHIKSLVG